MLGVVGRVGQGLAVSVRSSLDQFDELPPLQDHAFDATFGRALGELASP